MAESSRDEIAKLEALYANNPEGRVFTHLAEAYRKAGELDRALSILEAGLPRHMGYASAHVVLGRVLIDQQKSEEAAEAFRRVLSLDPHNMVARRELGEIAHAAGRHEEAREHYEELQLLDPSSDDIALILEQIAAAPRPAPEPPEPEPEPEPEAQTATATEPEAEAEAESHPEPEPQPEPEPGPDQQDQYEHIVAEAAPPEPQADFDAERDLGWMPEDEENQPLPGDLAGFAGLSAADEPDEQPDVDTADSMGDLGSLDMGSGSAGDDDVGEPFVMDAFALGAPAEEPPSDATESAFETTLEPAAEALPAFDDAVEDALFADEPFVGATTEALAFEEAVFEERVFEEPVFEEPVVEEPAFEEPAFEAPAPEPPAFEEPTAEEPVFEEPAFEMPAAEAPAFEMPATETPAYESPVAEAPVADAAVPEIPVAEIPAFEAVTFEPLADEPLTDEPFAGESISSEPFAEEPEPAGEVVTETIAELYRSQGLHDRAADVYRALLQQRPDDAGLRARLQELEGLGRPGGQEVEAPAVEASPEPAASETALAAEQTDPWIAGASGAAESAPTPYAWTEQTPEPQSEAGPAIISYFQSLLTWHSSGPAPAPAPVAQIPDAAAAPAKDEEFLLLDEHVVETEFPVVAPPEPVSEPEPAAPPASPVEDLWKAPATAAPAAEPWDAPPPAAPEPVTPEPVTPAVEAPRASRPSPLAPAGDSTTPEGAFDEWFGPAETAEPAALASASPSPEELPPEGGDEDDDLEMFRSWLQSLKK